MSRGERDVRTESERFYLWGRPISGWPHSTPQAVSVVYTAHDSAVLDLAVPLLNELQIPATLYLTPASILPSARKWQERLTDRIEVGIGPILAPHLRGLRPLRDLAKVHEEVVDAKRCIAEFLNRTPTSYMDSAGSSELSTQTIAPWFDTVIGKGKGPNSANANAKDLATTRIRRYPSEYARAIDESRAVPNWTIINFSGLSYADEMGILTHRMILEAIQRRRHRMVLGTVGAIAARIAHQIPASGR